MDEPHILKTLLEGCITYAFFLLMTTPRADIVLAKAKVLTYVAHSSQALARTFGRIGIAAERHATEILQTA